jgi:hypothetical protein
MRRPPIIIGLILVVLCGLAAWTLWKPSAVSQPEASTLPSAADGSAKSQAAGAARQVPTASETMSPDATNTTATAPRFAGAQLDLLTIRDCHDALVNKKALELQVDCDDIPAEQVSSQILCRSQQARAAQQVNEAAAAAASCPQDLLSASAYYEAIKKLAVTGNIPAQRCFIQGYFASAAQEGEESWMRKDEVDEYSGLAKRFIDEAFERGDWSVVRWLARIRIGLQDFMLRTTYPFGLEHPETAYRMNYLLMLGSQQNFDSSVDAYEFVETSKKHMALTSKQLQEAEDWARNMFEQHFDGSQEGRSITQFCEHS